MWACLLAGCISNATARAETAAVGVEYALALNDCFDAAVATKNSTHDAAKAGAQYTTCANAADTKYGRKK